MMQPRDYVAEGGSVADRGVVLIPEWWGLVDHIRSVSDWFADEGFHAVGLDIFDGRTADSPEEGRKLAGSLDPQVAIGRVREAVEGLGVRYGLPPRSVGVVGWCMGGGLTFRYAIESGAAGAAIGFYGAPPSAEELIQVEVPTLGIFGETDHVYPAEAVRSTARTLRVSGSVHRFILAKAVGHAFFNDTRDSFEPDTAEWAWLTVLLWFRHWLTPVND